MRLLRLAAVLFTTLNVCAETPASALWSELKAKREQLPGLHQEFDVSQTIKTAKDSKSSKRQIVLDISGGQWREKSATGSGGRIRIFDGRDLYRMEEGGDEFVRTKRKPKEDDPMPVPYNFGDPDWSRAVERERRPCGIPGKEHVCVILEVPLKRRARAPAPPNGSIVLEGSAAIMLDTGTGLLMSVRTAQLIETGNKAYQSDIKYVLERMSYGTPGDASLFKLPADNLSEVKELSPWNAAKIKKQLTGKPAPALAVTDMQGKPLRLAAFKGKTVLLDFWTTWCAPCRVDAPALDKLYRKYAGDLIIVGVSVSEERAVVEKFLAGHPHSFPIVLTTENEMPRPYQVGVFPTYMVIERDGTLAAAVEGDQGFSDLRKLLKKAGLELE